MPEPKKYVWGNILEKLYIAFRQEAVRRFSSAKGHMGKAMAEAFEVWLQFSKSKPAWDKTKEAQKKEGE